MIPTRIDQFLELVQRSSLVSPSQLIEACQGFSIMRDDSSALDDLCRQLIDKGLLTDWQCEKLRMGKWKGFFLDGYCLLGRTGEDQANSTATYLCKDTNAGRNVEMIVTNPDLTVGGPVQYVIRELASSGTP